jgi:hypothetical protein
MQFSCPSEPRLQPISSELHWSIYDASLPQTEMASAVLQAIELVSLRHPGRMKAIGERLRSLGDDIPRCEFKVILHMPSLRDGIFIPARFPGVSRGSTPGYWLSSLRD